MIERNNALSTSVGLRLLALAIADPSFDYFKALQSFRRYFNHGGVRAKNELKQFEKELTDKLEIHAI